MALPQGIEFRNTAGFVTTLAGDDAEHSAGAGFYGVSTYPRTTAQGQTVGWEFVAGISTRDRNSGIDARLAGGHFNGTTAKEIYRIDLPTSGTKNIRLAMGDNNYTTNTDTEVFDTTTSLGVLTSGTTSAAARWKDATNVERTSAADWVTNNASVSKTFSTTIMRVHIGNGTVSGHTISYLYVEDGGPSGPTIDVQPVTQRVPIGDAASFSVSATTSGGSLTYQWQDNTSGSFANVSGATSSTYTTSGLSAGTAYAVRVVVTDSNGSATSDPADAWTPAIEPHPWWGHYSKGGQRDFLRANLKIPQSGAAALVYDDAMWGAPPGAVTHDTSGSLVSGSAAVAGAATQATPEPPALQSAQPIPAAWYVDPGYAAAYFPHRYGVEVSNRGNAGATHDTSGALVSGSAQVAGSAVRTLPHATSGALTAGSAQVAGSAARTLPHATSGALAAGSATVAGTAAQTRAHASSGALVTGSATVAGSAVRTLPHATSGALVAGSAVIAGTADHTIPGGTHDSSGALVAGPAQVAGSAVLNRLHATSGALTADAAAVSGAAAQTRAHASSGAIVAGSATVAGTAAQTRAHATSGALASGSAVVAGSATQAAGGIHTTSGELVAGSAQVSGVVTGPAQVGNGFGFEMSSGTPRKRRSMVYVIDDKTQRSSAKPEIADTPENRRQIFKAARAQAETIIKSAAEDHAARGVSKAVRYGNVRTSLKPIAADLGDWNWINLYQRLYDQALTEQIKAEVRLQDEAEEDAIISLLLVSL
jgi:hypothetical protein